MTDSTPEPTLEKEAPVVEESAPVAEVAAAAAPEAVAEVAKTESVVATEPSATPDPHADWSLPLPAEIPRSTYLPAVMAFGITFFLWGFVSSPVVLGIGLLVTVVALVGWIGEMRHGA